MATPGRRAKAEGEGAETPYKEIGGRVRRIREQKGLGQKELADLIGMSNTNLWKIEKGQVLPTMENLKLFKKHLGADEAEILFGSPMVQRKKAHERLMAKYAAERRWPMETARMLSELPWELLGVYGAPSLADVERTMLFIDTNRALAGRGAR